jgi:hypothetical protein
MPQAATHLVDHVISQLPERQWVLSLPVPIRVLLPELRRRGTEDHRGHPRGLVIAKILTHLGLDSHPPPRGRARKVAQD